MHYMDMIRYSRNYIREQKKSVNNYKIYKKNVKETAQYVKITF